MNYLLYPGLNNSGEALDSHFVEAFFLGRAGYVQNLKAPMLTGALNSGITSNKD